MKVKEFLKKKEELYRKLPLNARRFAMAGWIGRAIGTILFAIEYKNTVKELKKYMARAYLFLEIDYNPEKEVEYKRIEKYISESEINEIFNRIKEDVEELRR